MNDAFETIEGLDARIVELEALLLAARQQLRYLEWANETCVVCMRQDYLGHLDNCSLGVLLTKIQKLKLKRGSRVRNRRPCV